MLPFVGYSLPVNPKKVVADNLRILIAYAGDHGGACYDAKRLALRAGLTPSTVGRILSLEHAPGVDTLDALARAFRLRAWQLLIPNLDPSNPPVVPYTDAERELYWRIKSAARDYARTGEIDDDEDEAPDADDGPPALPDPHKEVPAAGPHHRRKPK